MKKQFLQLTMVFCALLAWSTNAMASAGDTPSDPLVLLAGSTTTLEITGGGFSNTYSWNLYDYSSAEPRGALPSTTGDEVVTNTFPSTGTHHATDLAGNPATLDLVFTDNAAGAYYLEYTETRVGATTCAGETRRGFHIFVLGFNAIVYSSDADGNEYTNDALSACGSGTFANYGAFGNVATNDAHGTARTGGQVVTDTETDGSIDKVVGTGTTTTRYFTVQVQFESAPTGATFTSPSSIASIGLDITPTVSSDLISVNGTATTSGTALTAETINQDASTNLKYVFEVISNARWGTDITEHVFVENVTLYGSADGSGVSLGSETATNVTTTVGDNKSSTQTVEAAPAPSVISVQ